MNSENRNRQWESLVLYKCPGYTKGTHSARVVLSTSYSDVTSRWRPNLGPYVSFPDVILRPGVRRTLFVRPIRTRRRCDIFLHPGRIRTSGKLSYGPKLGRPLDVRGRLAEWVQVNCYWLYACNWLELIYFRDYSTWSLWLWHVNQ